MPELPEVETLRRSLQPTLQGNTLTDIYVNRPDLRKPFPPHLKTILLGKTIHRLRRRAKYLLIDFDHNWTLLIHLGMSGRIFIDPVAAPPPRKHEHMVLVTNKGVRISLVDPRRFGLVDLYKTSEENTSPLLRHLGLEPLDDITFTPNALFQALFTTRSPLKNALLDQHRIVGLGNIYVCEALFRAQLSPLKAANTLSKKETNLLHSAIVYILQQAIEAGGSTLRDYVHTDGRPGAFQELHLVYGKEGGNCPRCEGKGRIVSIKRITQSGRSTFFCSHCQKNGDKRGELSKRKLDVPSMGA